MQTFLKPCRWGQFLLIHGDLISNYVDRLGYWCDIEVDLFRILLPAETGVTIEVGANIGMHTVPLAKLCSRGEVICYEPQRPIFHVMCANLALNNCLNVRTRHAAAGEAAGRIPIQTSNYDAPWNYGSFSISKGFSSEGDFTDPVNSEMVEIVALDEDPALDHLQSLNFLKIDAEGHELGVLRGAEHLIVRHRPDIFVEPGSTENVDAIIEFMKPHGYSGYWFVGRRFGPDEDFETKPGSIHHDVNLVFRPDGAPPLHLPALISASQLPRGIPVLTSFENRPPA
jgi:FkbM family methyltransferase